MKDEEKKRTLKSKPQESPQATVLRQLNKQHRYSLRERISIFIVASLSVAGLLLIIYTGMMIVLRDGDEYGADNVNVDLGDLDDMLADLDVLLGTEDESPTQDEDNGYEYTHPDDGMIENEDDLRDMGSINADRVRFVNQPGDRHAVLFLDRGDRVTLINFNYNVYWAQVEVTIDLGNGPFAETGFVYKHFIDTD